MRDLFAFGFLQAIVQYCDAYMFFKSYAVVVKVRAWKRLGLELGLVLGQRY
jgi:hypothetical protein